MSNPTRLYAGLSTAYPNETLYSFPFPDPFHTGSTQTLGSSTYTNDFNTLIGTDYTVTGTSSTFALTAGVGGLAILTPGGTTTATSAYKSGQFFQIVSGNRFWYTTRIQASAVAGNVSFYAGLQAGSSTNDGLWFSKAAASTSINLVSVVGGTSTTIASGIATVAAATWIEFGLYYNGTDLLVFVNNVPVARISSPTVGSSATTLTNAVMGPVFQITPTATDTLTTDFVLACQEVNR
jgi:hypothetical protein